MFGRCSVRNRKKSTTVGDTFLRENSAEAGKKLATNVLKNPGIALEITSNIATRAATGKPQAYYQHYQRCKNSIIRLKDSIWSILFSLCITNGAKKLQSYILLLQY